MDIFSKLQKPNKVSIDVGDEIDLHESVKCTVFVEPLERGFGHTLGTALRRIMLSSIPGYSISAAVIEGVRHEFDSIKGVEEDVLQILLNLKQVSISLNAKNYDVLNIDIKGPAKVYASDLVVNQDVVIHNPGLPIVTINKDVNLKMKLYVTMSFGYVLAENQDYSPFGDELPVNLLKLDSLYSPILNVSYSVEGARIEEHTNYDKLIFSVETNGSIPAQRAVKIASKILENQLYVFSDIDNFIMNQDNKTDDNEAEKVLKRKVTDLDLGVRSLNCLKTQNIDTVGELIEMTEKQLLRAPNLGRKSLDEIKKHLESLGVSLRKD